MDVSQKNQTFNRTCCVQCPRGVGGHGRRAGPFVESSMLYVGSGECDPAESHGRERSAPGVSAGVSDELHDGGNVLWRCLAKAVMFPHNKGCRNAPPAPTNHHQPSRRGYAKPHPGLGRRDPSRAAPRQLRPRSWARTRHSAATPSSKPHGTLAPARHPLGV